MKPDLRHARPLAATFLLTLAIGGCADAPEPLNSERISRKFGNYGLELIENNYNIRVSNPYSVDARGRTCRTFAVVGFGDGVEPRIAAEHDRIRNGGSTGAVFRERGWDVRKRHLHIGEMTVGRQATRLSDLMRVRMPATLAVHVYVLAVAGDGHAFDYAMIAEVHHPDYLTMADLRHVYGGAYSGDDNRKDTRAVLAILRSKFRQASYAG